MFELNLFKNFEKNYVNVKQEKKENFFLDIDWFFSQKMQPKNKEEKFFFAYLFCISRQGHLCLKIENKQLYPDIINFDNYKDSEILKKIIIKGSASIADRKKSDFNNKGPLRIWDNHFYLQKNFIYESKILEYLKKIIENKPENIFDLKIFKQEIFKIKKEKILTSEQIQSIENVAESSISLICGGPGTGKTFTASFLIKLFNKSLFNQKSLKIAITAPTGRAAKHLHKSIIKNNPNVNIQAITLHKLLNIQEGRGKHFGAEKLDYNLIVVDEASMIDAKIMSHLLDQIADNKRLVFMGDNHQLSPIESGNIFSDLSKSSIIKTSFLKKNMRFANQHLAEFSQAIRNGDQQMICKMLDHQKINFYDISKKNEIYKIIYKYIDNFYEFSKKEIDPQKALKNIEKFRILTSLRKGVLGVNNLNQYIIDHIFTQLTEKDWFYIPIMIIKNNYEMGLQNGTIGVYISKYSKQNDLTNGYVYFNDLDGVKKYNIYQLFDFEYSFCSSIHKSQGSEFENVLVLLFNTKDCLGKELLYTAVTRAKNYLSLITNKKDLLEILNKQSTKRSNLVSRLEQLFFVAK